ncbi:MAG: hypothetical protein WCJ30_14410, partial [Deltaproteobacteria bacterium]
MNARSLASPVRSRWIVLAAAALLAACSTPSDVDGSPGNDTGVPVDANGMDIAAVETGSDASADRPRLRDTGQEISLDSAFGQCFVAVTPRTGTRADTFVISGTGIHNATMAALTVQLDGTTTPIVNMQVPVTAGAFTYSLPGSTLAVGNYTVNVNDPTFTCSTY